MRDLTSFITALIDAHEGGPRVSHDVVPETLDEAYQVQAALMDRFGPVGGWKVAAKPGQPQIMAPIRADRVFDSGVTVPVHDRIGLELEVAFEVVTPLPSAFDKPADLVPYVRPRPVIELVDTRLTGAAAEPAMAKLADLQINEAVILGAPLTDWDGRDFGPLTARFTYGAEVLLDGETTVPGGSALANLALLARLSEDHCGGLQPGQVAITGTLNGLPYHPAGGVAEGHIDGLGGVRVTLA